MIRQCFFLISISTLAVCANDSIANYDPFLEQNGRLVIEVESGRAEGNWLKQNTIDGHTGAGYLVWNGSNNYAKSEAPRGNPVQYHFRITNPGNYQLRWRSRNTIGLDATEHNDSWVRFPTGTNIDGEHFLSGWTKAYMGQVQQWTWDAYTVDNNNKPIRQYFDKGDHVVEISGRSNGHGLDRFALFRYEQEQFNATLFDTLSQSPRVSQADLPAHAVTGNSCVAGSLSLSVDAIVQSTDTSSSLVDTKIRLDDSENTAFLRFRLPKVQTGGVSLKLASLQQSLGISVYLGSHDDWAEDTLEQNLPYASTLLGTYQSDTATNRIQQLSLPDSLVSGDRLTLLLKTSTSTPQSLHGIATALEPRLEIDVPLDFCSGYHAARAGTGAPVTDEENGSPVADNDDNDNNDNTGVVSETEQTPDSTPVETQSPFDVPDPLTAVDGQNQIDVPQSKRGGGSLSLWGLFVLAVTMCFLNSRTHHVSARLCRPIDS